MAAAPKEERASFLAIACVVKPQGRRGEVAAEILTDFPQRFAALRKAYLENASGAPEPVEVESAWPHRGRIILKFSGVDSIQDANRLRGLHVLLPREERMALPAHHYYLWELEGCRVVMENTEGRREIGTVTGVEPTAGVPLLHVEPADRRHDEILIPLAQEICQRIDTTEKMIVINPPEDLLELNDQL